MTEIEKQEFYKKIVQANPLSRKPEETQYQTFIRKRKNISNLTRGAHQPEPGRLTFINELTRKDIKSPKVYYLCICDCGNWYITRQDAFNKTVADGGAFSCGCLNKESYTKVLNSEKVISKRIEKLRNTLEKSGRIPQIGDEVQGWKITASEMRSAPFGTGDKISRYVKAICPYCGQESDWIRFDGISSKQVISCGCRRSYYSIPVLNIERLLEEANIPYVTEKTFESCRFPDSNNKAKFDFYINNQYLLEYDGEQHFKRGFGRGEEELKALQARDQFKNLWSKENKIPLIRIPHTHKDNIVLEDLLLETSQFIID